jgi:hypothetical protein
MSPGGSPGVPPRGPATARGSPRVTPRRISLPKGMTTRVIVIASVQSAISPKPSSMRPKRSSRRALQVRVPRKDKSTRYRSAGSPRWATTTPPILSLRQGAPSCTLETNSTSSSPMREGRGVPSSHAGTEQPVRRFYSGLSSVCCQKVSANGCWQTLPPTLQHAASSRMRRMEISANSCTHLTRESCTLH